MLSLLTMRQYADDRARAACGSRSHRQFADSLKNSRNSFLSSNIGYILLMDTLADIPEDYFNEFINRDIEVECKSWPECFARAEWGPNFAEKCTPGEIQNVKMNRKTNTPLFTVYFPEVDQLVTKLDLDYILKYCVEVPLKYHFLKADYIVRLAKAAAEEAKSTKVGDGKATTIKGKEPANNNVADSKERAAKGKAPAKKRSSLAVEVDLNEDEMFVSSDIEYSANEESDCDDETYLSDEKESPKNSRKQDKKESKKEDSAEMDVDTDVDFIKWSFGKDPVIPERTFTGVSGPRHGLDPDRANPFDYFCLFIPIFFYTRFANYTNKKAELESNKKDGHVHDWQPTSAAEIRAWFASVMWYCIIKGLSIEHFLKGKIDPNRARIWFPSFRRWADIKRYLKISDPLKDPQNVADRMYRVRELFDYFISACKANYWPDTNVALDEAIKKFKGRCIFKQYIKNKPVRWGIKIFAVCCSATAYLWNAMFYLGKRKEESNQDVSVTTETVINLLTPLQGKNHRVHMDNYYTSIPLFQQLAALSIWCTGTVRVNRKGLDKQVCIKKSEESELKKKPGYHRFSSHGSMSFTSWFDKRPVHVLSNCYPPNPTGDEHQAIVKRWYDARKGEEGATLHGKISREIFIPMCILFYNMFMGAVDVFDQFRSYIKLELRSGKFWHPMMWFILESALVNAWVLYKATREAAGLALEFTHLEFRVSIALALASEWEAMGCVHRAGLLNSPSTEFASKTAKKARKTLLSWENNSNRGLQADICRHFEAIERIPLLEGGKNNKGMRILQCEQCKNRRTTVWCRLCAAPLCQKKGSSCFADFHSAQKKL
jgi:Transposase IS4